MDNAVRVRDSGSTYSPPYRKEFSRSPRSLFDQSYLNTFDAKIGKLYPVWTQFTLPNEDYTIKLEAFLRCINPPLVPLMSRMRVFFHTYWCSFDSLWRGWQAFMTKGRFNDFVAKVPNIKVTKTAFDKGLFSRGSLADFLGLNFSGYDDSLFAQDFSTSFSALPFLAYQHIYRDYYLNANTKVSGDERKKWFPYDDDLMRFTLQQTDVLLDEQPLNPDESDYNVESIGLGVLRDRLWTADYFTSGRPWPQRGQETVMDVPLSFDSDAFLPLYGYDSDGNVTDGLKAHLWRSQNSPYGYSSVVAMDSKGSGIRSSYIKEQSPSDLLGVGAIFNGSFVTGVQPSGPSSDFTLGVTLKDFGGDAGIKISLSMLRDLNATQRILEKMALTDGSYGEFCQTFFGITPKSAKHHRPVYVGGCYQPVVISEVLQVGGTKYSADKEIESLQGQQTGHAISSGSGDIGKFHSDDFGILMTIMSIVPDTMYCQGVNRRNTASVQEDFYLPERAGLSPQGVLVQELYNRPGLESQSETHNLKLFCYQDRWEELRYRGNEVHGQVADSTNLTFFPMTILRYFEAEPVWNESFLTMTQENVKRDWLSVPDESAFVCQIANRIRQVSPVPYVAKPAELFDTSH